MKQFFLVVGIMIISLYGCRNVPVEPEDKPKIFEWFYFEKISLYDRPDYNDPQKTAKYFHPVEIFDNTVYVRDTIILFYNYEYTNLPNGVYYKEIDKPVMIRVSSKSGDYEDLVLKNNGGYIHDMIDLLISARIAMINYFPIRYPDGWNNGLLSIQTPVDTLTATYNSPFQDKTFKSQIILKTKQ
jgi:hypothetical protein